MIHQDGPERQICNHRSPLFDQMLKGRDFFGDTELDLECIAHQLHESLPLEEAFRTAGIAFAIKLDTYSGGLIFRSECTGVFFRSLPEKVEAAKEILRGLRLKPHDL